MFTIILKNEKLTSYNRLALFILLIHLLFFTGELLKAPSDVNTVVPIAGMIISLIGFGFNIKSVSKNNKPLVPFVLIFIALAVVWVMLTNLWPPLTMLVLAFLDVHVRKKITVIFSDDGIVINTFPSKKYQWAQLGNVILKDRILTLDFKDDRLIQTEIAEESWKIHEGIFNEFCNEHLGTGIENH